MKNFLIGLAAGVALMFVSVLASPFLLYLLYVYSQWAEKFLP